MQVLDTETALIAPGLQAPPLVCMSLGDGSLLSWREAGERLASLLDGGELLVGHNIAFDFCVLATEYPLLLPKIWQAYEEDRVEDTGIRQKLIDNANGNLRGFLREGGTITKINYSLEDLSLRHLRIQLDKEGPWRLRYGELRNVPIASWPEGARKYALDDSYATGGVWTVQEQKEHKRWLDDQHRQARAEFWMKLMSCWGLRTDPKAVQEFERVTREESARLAKVLVEHGLLRPDKTLKSGPRKGLIVPGSRNTKATAERMRIAFRAKGLEPPLTDGAMEKLAAAEAMGFAPPPDLRICLDEDACISSGDPVLKDYADFSSLKKKISTDIPLLWSGTINPIHSYFETLLETGRTSSSPNVQNLPRRGGMRECFIPRPGFVFAAADYSGLELRTWSQVCVSKLGHSRMAEVLNAGGDPHLMMAAAIMECSYEEAKSRKEMGDEKADDARQSGKIANFGYPGGLGPDNFVHFAALQYGVHLSVEQARGLKALWLKTWPEGREYLFQIGKAIDVNPQIEHLFSGRVRGNVRYTEACNSYFQGLGADAAKSAGWLVSRACYIDTNSPLFGSRIVNFVHDELILEVPIEIGHECLLELCKLMKDGASPWLPNVPPEVEGVLMRRWSKKAKPVFRNGRTIAFDHDIPISGMKGLKNVSASACVAGDHEGDLIFIKGKILDRKIERWIDVPPDTRREAITASYQNGSLNVSIPTNNNTYSIAV